MAGRIGYNGADKWKIKATELLNEGGGGGTDDYDDLENKPKINNVELSGNKTAAELGINIPTQTSDLTNDSGFITKSVDDLENYYKKISYVDISEYPYGGTGYYSGVITIDEDYQTGSNREYMSLWPNGIKLNFVYQDPDNPMMQRIVRDQLVSNFELWSLHGISKNIQDQIDALPTSDTTYTFSVGDANGEIKVTPSSGNAYNVSVKGLGSAAYADTSDFQVPISGGATTIVSSNLTASRALISDSSGKVAVSAVTSTELGYLDGVTSAIQTQLDDKLPLAGGTLTGALTTKSIITNGTNLITSSLDTETTPSSTKYSNLLGMTDKNNKYLMYMRGWLTSAGLYGFQIRANRYITDTDYSNYFSLCIDASGNRSVSFSHPAAWITGLGLGSAAVENADTAATASTIAKRDSNGYLKAVYFNMTHNSRANPASYTAYPAFVSSDGYLRMSTLANFQNFVTGSTAFTFTKSIGTINYQKCYSLLNGHINVINVRMAGLSGLVENKGAVQLGSIPSANAPSTTFYCPFAHTGSIGGEQYIYIGTDGKVYIAMSDASGVSNVMFNIVYVK